MANVEEQRESWTWLSNGIAEKILNAFLGDESYNMTRSVDILRKVHPNWRQDFGAFVHRLSPRVPFFESLEMCMESVVRGFPHLRHVKLPPLCDDLPIDLSRLADLQSFDSLELAHSNLSGVRGLSALVGMRKLRMDSVTVNSVQLDAVSNLTNLRSLSMKAVRIMGEGNGALLSKLPTLLSHLEVINCPQLVKNGFLPLLDLEELRSLALGVDSVDEVDVVVLSACDVDISLALFEDSNLAGVELQPLSRLRGLRSLKLLGGGTSDIPTWLCGLPLQTLYLSDKNQILFNDRRQIDNLPTSLCSLSINMSHANQSVLNNFLSYAQGLTDLSLSLTCFAGLHLPLCTKLRDLKISSREFDGEQLETVGTLMNLESLQIGGCSCLDGHHIRHLSSLKCLRSLSVGSSTFTKAACEEIGSLSGLYSLSFYVCPTLLPRHLDEMPNLRRLAFVLCMHIEDNLDSLFSKAFVPGLAFIGFQFFNMNRILSTIERYQKSCQGFVWI